MLGTARSMEMGSLESSNDYLGPLVAKVPTETPPPSSHSRMCGTHTTSARPLGPGRPVSLQSGPSCHQDPESTPQQYSGRCLRPQPGCLPPPCGTDQSLPCSDTAPRQSGARHRDPQPLQPGQTAVPPLPAASLGPLVLQAQLAQRTQPGVCAPVCLSVPGSPGPAPVPRTPSGVGARLGPGGLGAQGVQEIPAVYLKELERTVRMREGWELAACSCFWNRLCSKRAETAVVSLPLELSSATMLGTPRRSINSC